MSRSKFTYLEKMDLLTEYKNSNVLRTTFARNHGISPTAFKSWIMILKRDGIDGLKERKTNQKYTEKFKVKVVQAALNGQGTYEELMIKYGLRNVYQISDWIFKYNNGKSLTTKYSSGKKVSFMTRKTTFEERIEIVEYVVKHNHKYSEAAEHFSVSYQQVRQWVLKSQKGGYEALLDGRGHRKSIEDMSDLDKANLKIRQLESKLRDQKIIEEFAKKLKELQRKG